jgi:hypothetical protein
MLRYKLSWSETNDEESSEGDAMQPSERHLRVCIWNWKQVKKMAFSAHFQLNCEEHFCCHNIELCNCHSVQLLNTEFKCATQAALKFETDQCKGPIRK